MHNAGVTARYQIIHLRGEMVHLPALGGGEHVLLAGDGHDVARARLAAPHVGRPREVQRRAAPAAHVRRAQQRAWRAGQLYTTLHSDTDASMLGQHLILTQF